MTLLQEKNPLPTMPGQHKRPLLAFVVVALVCGVVIAQAVRSDAVMSLLRTAAGNVVSGSSLVHHPASESPLVDTTEVGSSGPPHVIPGYAFGHDKGKAQGRARGHERAGSAALPGAGASPRQGGASSLDGVTGHARSHLGGQAKGHTKDKAQGKAKGHHKAHGGNQKGHARAHTRGADRR